MKDEKLRIKERRQKSLIFNHYSLIFNHHSLFFNHSSILSRALSIISIVFLLVFLPLPFALRAAHAQSADSTSLTITPPFFELNVNPGDSWSSVIRVVNTNASDITVHAQVMGFGASDAEGHGSFTPLSQLTDDADALANWITVASPMVTVPRGQAADVPFSITVPASASPGGHYAGILIGTGAATPQPGVSQVGVSSFVSALIFVRVAGNITEAAHIQSFTADKPYYQTPDVNFKVNFQNDGDVHVRPVGLIQIYNAFGKQRGQIPINDTGNLGYVLPSSSREFDVGWQGQASLLDIGPYSAVLSLAYGENGTKNVAQTITFWILPIDQILEVAFLALIVIFLFMYVMKRVVRKMLARELSEFGGNSSSAMPQSGAGELRQRFEPQKKSAKPSSGDDVLDLRKPRDKI